MTPEQMLLEACDDALKALRLCKTTMNATPEQFQAVAPECVVMIQTHIDQLETAVDRAISAAIGATKENDDV